MTTLLNREVLRRVLDTGEPLRHAVNRCVGKTTSAILAAIAESYKRPGEWVGVDDPDVQTEFIRRNLVSTVRETLRRLGLEHIDVALRPVAGQNAYCRVAVLNTFCESLT